MSASLASLDFRDHAKKNGRKSIYLLTGLFGVLMVALVAITFQFMDIYTGLIVSLALSIILPVIAYFSAAKAALYFTGARETTAEEAPVLHNIVEEMSLAAGVPKPKVYVVNDPSPNAFATGRNPENSAVAVTTGILNVLDRDELQAVIGHEIGHIRNRDIKVSTISVAVVGIIAAISEFGLRTLFVNSNNRNPVFMVLGVIFLLLAPIAALVLQASVSRSRESLADASAVEFTRNPTGMRRALESISNAAVPMAKPNNATAHLWLMEPLALDDNGNVKKKNGFTKLFSTHPPIEERIEYLRKMEGELGRSGEEQPSVTEKLTVHRLMNPELG